MIRFFGLETILTAVSRINCTDSNIRHLSDLFYFVFDDEYINATGFEVLSSSLRNHLFTLYPELVNASVPDCKIDHWIKKQKEKFGDYLPVCPINQTLNEDHSLERKY